MATGSQFCSQPYLNITAYYAVHNIYFFHSLIHFLHSSHSPTLSFLHSLTHSLSLSLCHSLFLSLFLSSSLCLLLALSVTLSITVRVPVTLSPDHSLYVLPSLYPSLYITYFSLHLFYLITRAMTLIFLYSIFDIHLNCSIRYFTATEKSPIFVLENNFKK